jgi:alpha-D-ribose 1-methylphosphonate 5-triphosphate synthase subunit PhnG
MTVSRCVVQIVDGQAGYGYVAGRALRHAELAAVFDALFQDPQSGYALEEEILGPIEYALGAEQRQSDAAVAESRVEFFTLVRGDP